MKKMFMLLLLFPVFSYSQDASVVHPSELIPLNYLDSILTPEYEEYIDDTFPLLDRENLFDPELNMDMYNDVLVSSSCGFYCGASYAPCDTSLHDAFWDYSKVCDLSYKPYIIHVPCSKALEVAYCFDKDHPRVTEIIVVPGDARTSDSWQKYARVKTLEVVKNDVVYDTLQLQDVRSRHHFPVDTLGRQGDDWKLSFVVLDVYPGEIDSLAIGEIYFDGIDVH